ELEDLEVVEIEQQPRPHPIELTEKANEGELAPSPTNRVAQWSGVRPVGVGDADRMSRPGSADKGDPLAIRRPGGNAPPHCADRPRLRSGRGPARHAEGEADHDRDNEHRNNSQPQAKPSHVKPDITTRRQQLSNTDALPPTSGLARSSGSFPNTAQASVEAIDVSDVRRMQAAF